MAFISDTAYLSLQCAIISAWVDFLIFNEGVLGNGIIELLVSKEIVIDTVLFPFTRTAVGRGNRELHVDITLLQQSIYDGGFSTS